MKAAQVFSSASSHSSPRLRYSQTAGALWILHGVTPEDDRCLLDDEGDDVWYIDQFDSFLEQNYTTSVDLRELMREGIYTLSDQFGSGVGAIDLDVSFFPAAMVSLVRFDLMEGTLGYFNLGDAVLLIEMDDELYRVCANDGVISDPTVSDSDWWLSFAPGAVEYARTGTLPLEDVSAIHLFTQAVDYVVNTQEVFEEWGHVLDAMGERGVQPVLDELQEVAAGDDDFEPDLAFATICFSEAELV